MSFIVIYNGLYVVIGFMLLLLAIGISACGYLLFGYIIPKEKARKRQAQSQIEKDAEENKTVTKAAPPSSPMFGKTTI